MNDIKYQVRIFHMNDCVLSPSLYLWELAQLKNEFGYTFGPKGKIPFITYNGEDVADSQFCIEFLSKTLDKSLSKGHSAKDLGSARAFFKMAEESLFWWDSI